MLPESMADLEQENPALQSPAEPSRLDLLLLSSKISDSCKDILHSGGDGLTKLFLTKSRDITTDQMTLVSQTLSGQ